MATQDSKSWLLGGGYSWRTSVSNNIRADEAKGLSLVARRPYVPPPFRVLACQMPAVEIGGHTYEIDRELREINVYTAQGRLRHRWMSRDQMGNHVPPADPGAWDPVDIVNGDGCVFVLDQQFQAVWVHIPGRESLSFVFCSQNENSIWKRLSMDDAGCLLIFDASQKDALAYSRKGEFLGTRKASWPESPATGCQWLTYEINRHQRTVKVEPSLHDKQKKTLLRIWNSRDESGNYVSPNDPGAWDPIALAGDSRCTFLLDQRYQTIYAHRYGHGDLQLVCQSPKPKSQWCRLALNEAGWLVVFDANENQALLFDRNGQFRGTTDAAWPDCPPTDEDSKNSSDGSSDLPYEQSGNWLSATLDSSIYKCQWHRIRMQVKYLPPGSEIEVKTFSYQQKDQAPTRADDPRFVTARRRVAPTQPSPAQRNKKIVEEFLIQSGTGQYLSMAIQLQGDGFGTPVIQSMRVQFPRETYLEYLPPLYSGDEPMRVFLERFLSIFQSEWDEFDRRIEESEAFFDPVAVPEGVAMNYLASWLGLEMEGTWNAEQNRQLLSAVPKIFPKRGTPESLRKYLAVYLANIAGLTAEQVEQTAFPTIIEGFRERQYVMLSQAEGAKFGSAKPLWGPAVVKRLQLGGYSRADEVELVSTGDPERDPFHYFAHRFRVYVPAAWLRTKAHEQLLRRAIEAEMPAHVTYELCLVDAGLRVGIQSIVGLDTIVGDPPALRLSCEPEKQPSSLPRRNELGSGAVLSGKNRSSPVLGSGARVGDWILK